MENTTEIIEVNGVKLEVDLRTCKRVENLKVGSKVKILRKGNYSTPEVFPGVIVGFERFQTQPTIIVCYLEVSYSKCDLMFAYINSDSKDKWEMVATVDTELPVAKADVLSKIDTEIQKKKDEIEDIELRRDYFLRHFNKYFETDLA